MSRPCCNYCVCYQKKNSSPSSRRHEYIRPRPRRCRDRGLRNDCDCVSFHYQNNMNRHRSQDPAPCRKIFRYPHREYVENRTPRRRYHGSVSKITCRADLAAEGFVALGDGVRAVDTQPH